MKVLSAIQMRSADAYIIANEPITSFGLMERASAKCAEWIQSNFKSQFSLTIVCGTGNNGGDGLCIARMLQKAGAKVDVFVLNAGKKSADFLTAFHSAEEAGVQLTEVDTGAKLV